MLTQDQYNTAVFTAYRANAVTVQNLRAKEALGCYPDWGKATRQLLKIKSGLWSLRVGDYTSEASVDIYNQLLDIGSSWTGGIIFDANAQVPGTTIINPSSILPPPLSFAITAGVTSTPYTVSYDATLYKSGEYALIRTSNNVFDWNTNVEWVSGSFTILGDDDGTGHFADSFTFWIFP